MNSAVHPLYGHAVIPTSGIGRQVARGGPPASLALLDFRNPAATPGAGFSGARPPEARRSGVRFRLDQRVPGTADHQLRWQGGIAQRPVHMHPRGGEAPMCQVRPPQNRHIHPHGNGDRYGGAGQALRSPGCGKNGGGVDALRPRRWSAEGREHAKRATEVSPAHDISPIANREHVPCNLSQNPSHTQTKKVRGTSCGGRYIASGRRGAAATRRAEKTRGARLIGA